MDNIFGVGLPELVLILAIAGMVMGPERIVRAARSLGVLVARMREVSRSFFQQLNAEMDSIDQSGELKETIEELNQLRRQVSDLRDEVLLMATGTAASDKPSIDKLKLEDDHSILPPDLSAGSRRPPATGDGGNLVHRPPSLLGDDSPQHASRGTANSTAVAVPPPSIKRPKRVEISEDPDR